MSAAKIVLIMVFFIILISIQYTLNLILREIRNLRKDLELREISKKEKNPGRYKY